MRPLIRKLFPPALALVLGALVWQLVCWLARLPPYLLPPPGDVLLSFVKGWPELLRSFQVTAAQAACGFAASVIVGTLMAFCFSLSRPLRAAVYPLIVGLQAIPVLAFAPLVIIWNGYGFTSVVLISFLLSLVPIVVATTVGLNSVKPEFLILFELCGASRWSTLWRLRIPSALPYFFTGARTSCGLAVIGAVVGEQFVGDQRGWLGLGQLIMAKYNVLKVADLFAAVLVTILLSALGWLLVSAVAQSVAAVFQYRDGESAD